MSWLSHHRLGVDCLDRRLNAKMGVEMRVRLFKLRLAWHHSRMQRWICLVWILVNHLGVIDIIDGAIKASLVA